MSSLIREVLVLTESLRSNVAKNATLAIHDVFYRVPEIVVGVVAWCLVSWRGVWCHCFVGEISAQACQSVVEEALSCFLKRASRVAGGSTFLVDEAERALLQICLAASHTNKLLGYLLRQLEQGYAILAVGFQRISTWKSYH